MSAALAQPLFIEAIFSRFRGGLGGALAGIGDQGEVLEKFFAVSFREAAEDFGLEFEGEGTEGLIGLAAMREEANTMGAAVGFMRGALEEAIGFHPFQEGGDCVRIAGDEFGDLTLAEAFRIRFDQGSEYRELVGCDFQMKNAAAKGLVKTVPGAAQERGETAAFRCVEGQGKGKRGSH